MVKLDNLDDARHILKLAGRKKTAVVIGGGITALELVEGLRARGMKVHYLLRGERYWANVLDETESRLVEERLREEGVILHTHTQIKQALGKRRQLIGVETPGGREDRLRYSRGSDRRAAPTRTGEVGEPEDRARDRGRRVFADERAGRVCRRRCGAGVRSAQRPIDAGRVVVDGAGCRGALPDKTWRARRRLT